MCRFATWETKRRMNPEPKPKYPAENGGQRHNWLISYTDFVTVLLILFVAIAAQGLHTRAAASATATTDAANRKSRAHPERVNCGCAN